MSEHDLVGTFFGTPLYRADARFKKELERTGFVIIQERHLEFAVFAARAEDLTSEARRAWSVDA